MLAQLSRFGRRFGGLRTSKARKMEPFVVFGHPAQCDCTSRPHRDDCLSQVSASFADGSKATLFWVDVEPTK